MRYQRKVEFITRVRKFGRDYGSILLTVPKAVSLYLDLKHNDFVRVVIEKLKVEAKEAKE